MTSLLPKAILFILMRGWSRCVWGSRLPPEGTTCSSMTNQASSCGQKFPVNLLNWTSSLFHYETLSFSKNPSVNSSYFGWPRIWTQFSSTTYRIALPFLFSHWRHTDWLYRHLLASSVVGACPSRFLRYLPLNSSLLSYVNSLMVLSWTSVVLNLTPLNHRHIMVLSW